MQKHLIWGNYDLDPKSEDWHEFLEINCLLNEDEEYQEDAIRSMNDDYREDEEYALNDIEKNLPYGWSIICIGSLGLWDGVRTGYKFVKSLNDTLYMDDDYYELYCDGYHLRARGSHHDGNNSYTFLLFSGNKDYLTTGEDKFLYDLVHGNHISKARWHRYTRSIRPYIKEYYGW